MTQISYQAKIVADMVATIAHALASNCNSAAMQVVHQYSSF